MGLILKVLAGSRSYGLETPDSDWDSRGICIPPLKYLLGLQRFEQEESADHDHVVYSLEKFARLALAGNPNLVEMLFADPGNILHTSPAGERLREHRRLFLSRKVGRTFGGYAVDSLKKMERRYRWLREPPPEKPDPTQFGATMHEGRARFPDTDRERAYQGALRHWQQYETWRRERNPERGAMEARFGYDTKDAMHLLRLLRMAREILETGEVHVKRPDAEWLRSVRAGALPYTEVLAIARREEAELPGLTERSPLPPEPDHEAVEALVVELQAEYHFPDSQVWREASPETP